MAAFVEEVTLEEAVRMSKCINNVSFRWRIHENVLNIASPSNCCTFGSIEVFWCYTHDIYRTSANFYYQRSFAHCSVDYEFTSLQALCEAYPELFKTKGLFKVVH